MVDSFILAGYGKQIFLLGGRLENKSTDRSNKSLRHLRILTRTSILSIRSVLHLLIESKFFYYMRCYDYNPKNWQNFKDTGSVNNAIEDRPLAQYFFYRVSMERHRRPKKEENILCSAGMRFKLGNFIPIDA